MKNLPVGVELFHTDGRTDMTKLIVALRSFANAIKNELWKCPPLACVVTNPRD